MVDISIGAVLFVVVVFFVAERGVELVIELLSRLPGTFGGVERDSVLETRFVSHLWGFLLGAVLDVTFKVDLIAIVTGQSTDVQLVLNGLLVAWGADAAHQIIQRRRQI